MFQQDNAPVYNAIFIKTCFAKAGVEELDWPVQSIEHNTTEINCNAKYAAHILTRHQFLTSLYFCGHISSGKPAENNGDH